MHALSYEMRSWAPPSLSKPPFPYAKPNPDNVLIMQVPRAGSAARIQDVCMHVWVSNPTAPASQNQGAMIF